MSQRESLEHRPERLEDVQPGIDELADQVTEGEIDEGTAARLRASYQEEVATVEAELHSLPEEPAEELAAKPESPRAGLISGIAAGTVALVTAVIVVVIIMTGDDGSAAAPRTWSSPATSPTLRRPSPPIPSRINCGSRWRACTSSRATTDWPCRTTSQYSRTHRRRRRSRPPWRISAGWPISPSSSMLRRTT